jgi:hypothetical protein
MIATCQFCRQMIAGPALPDEPTEVQSAWAYRQLSMLVSNHMSERHQQEAGSEIFMAMALAGAAVAMRYVASADARLDSLRVVAGEQLIAAFTPAPPAPLVSLN